MQALQKLRKKGMSVESLQLEIDMLSSFKENEEKGTWREVFQGTNRVSSIAYHATALRVHKHLSEPPPYSHVHPSAAPSLSPSP